MTLFGNLLQNFSFERTREFLAPHHDGSGSSLKKAKTPSVTSGVTSVKAHVRDEIGDRVDKEPLNDPQKKAVHHIFGPLLVLAGAGTGKTRVIVTRFAQLVRLGVPPRRILGMTFTNKAVKEMQDRTKALLGPYCRGKPTLKTIHGLCSNVIRIHAAELGYNRHVEIAQDFYLERFIKRAINSKDPKSGEAVVPWYALERMKGDAVKEVSEKISEWKNNLIDADEAIKLCESFERKMAAQVRSGSTDRPIENPYELARVYKAYEEIKFRAGLIDVDDLLMLTVKLFETRPDILEAWQNRFDYVMVDEFQDTNRAQYRIARMLSEKHGNLMVVGDDDQSIYTWRGADTGIIRGFSADHGNCEIIKLEENYRCSQHILDLGNKLMESELGRIGKRLFAFKKDSLAKRYKMPEVIPLNDEYEEGEYIAGVISDANDREGVAYSSYAILVRDKYKMDPIASALQSKNIPYQIWESDKIQLGELKQNVYALLSVVHDPVEKDYAFMTLLETSTLRLPDHDYEIVSQAVDRKTVNTFWDALNSPELISNLSEEGQKKANTLRKLVDRLHKRTKIMAKGDSLTNIANHGIRALFPEITKDNNWLKVKKPPTYLRMLQDISGYIKSWEATAPVKTLNAFIGWTNRIRLLAKEPRRELGDFVVLATIHSVKGLEFDRVFVSACEEKSIPSKHAIEKEERYGNSAGIDEERRLFYVAITRAKDMLTFTLASCRKIGRRKDTPQEPSRFLGESGAAELYDGHYLRKNVKPRQKRWF